MPRDATPATSVVSVPTNLDLMDVGGEATEPPPFEDHVMVEIGCLRADACAVDPYVVRRLAELLDMQVSSGLNVFDFVLGRFALGDTDHEWKATKQLLGYVLDISDDES